MKFLFIILKIEFRLIIETNILATSHCLEAPWSHVSPPEGAMGTTGNIQR